MARPQDLSELAIIETAPGAPLAMTDARHDAILATPSPPKPDPCDADLDAVASKLGYASITYQACSDALDVLGRHAPASLRAAIARRTNPDGNIGQARTLEVAAALLACQEPALELVDRMFLMLPDSHDAAWASSPWDAVASAMTRDDALALIDRRVAARTATSALALVLAHHWDEARFAHVLDVLPEMGVAGEPLTFAGPRALPILLERWRARPDRMLSVALKLFMADGLVFDPDLDVLIDPGDRRMFGALDDQRATAVVRRWIAESPMSAFETLASARPAIVEAGISALIARHEHEQLTVLSFETLIKYTGAQIFDVLAREVAARGRGKSQLLSRIEKGVERAALGMHWPAPALLQAWSDAWKRTQ